MSFRKHYYKEGCPLDVSYYGGIPSGGGYSNETFYEATANEIAEALHCVLGSVGSMVRLKDYNHGGHIRHIDEEINIIENILNEYKKYIDIDLFYDDVNEKEFKKGIDSIRDASTKLYNMAKQYREDFEVKEPKSLYEIANTTYKFVQDLAKEMYDSVKYSQHDKNKAVNALRRPEIINNLSDLKKAFQTFRDEFEKEDMVIEPEREFPEEPKREFPAGPIEQDPSKW